MKILYKTYSLQKKEDFQNIIESEVSTLDHDLYIFGTCCNCFLCSLNPGKYTGNSYSITWVTKNILTQEKRICSVLAKSNVDDAKSQVESSTFLDWSCDFKMIWRSQKWFKNVRKRAFESWDTGISKARWIMSILQKLNALDTPFRFSGKTATWEPFWFLLL